MAVGEEKSKPVLVPLNQGELKMLLRAMTQYKRMVRFNEDAAVLEKNCEELSLKLDKSRGLPDVEHIGCLIKLQAYEQISAVFNEGDEEVFTNEVAIELAEDARDTFVRLTAPEVWQTMNEDSEE